MSENHVRAIPSNSICDSILDAVGYTPAVRLSRLFAQYTNAEIIAKLEYMNPSGSIKDRMVRYILKHAAQHGQLDAQHVVESSSGNTGAALAMACAVHQFRCDISVPASTCTEKIRRIGAYGANVHVCPASLPSDHADSYYAKAYELAEKENAYHLNQYCSQLNRDAHYHSTAPEIWAQMDGKIDYFICGIGSGGTISGIGAFLKERDPRIKVIGVEPTGSSYGPLLRHQPEEPATNGFSSMIEGIGKSKPAKSFDVSVVDDVIQVPDAQSLEYHSLLTRREGIFAGLSSGAAVAGIARLLASIGHGRVVTVFPDSGALYLGSAALTKVQPQT